MSDADDFMTRYLNNITSQYESCLLYTSDAADE